MGIIVTGAAEGIRKKFFMLIIVAGAAEDKVVGRRSRPAPGSSARCSAAAEITGAG